MAHGGIRGGAGAGAGAAAGARIRALRVQRDLSLTALARAAGIGKGSLSELETGRRNPTLETLYAVAGPLGVPLAALLDNRSGTVVADDGFEAVLLHADEGRRGTSEVYLLRVRAGVTRSSPAHVRGASEQLVVLEGGCRIEYGEPGGERALEIDAGGHAVWPADVPHRYTATGDHDLRAVNVISTRSKRQRS
jgi:transcriptional regulator with XRE-family HTH domain